MLRKTTEALPNVRIYEKEEYNASYTEALKKIDEEQRDKNSKKTSGFMASQLFFKAKKMRDLCPDEQILPAAHYTT